MKHKKPNFIYFTAGLALLSIIGAQSCGSLKKLPGSLGKKGGTDAASSEQSSSSSGDPSQNSKGGEVFEAKFLTLQENMVVDEKTPIKIDMNFSHKNAGKWSIYISDKQNGLVGSKLVAKDLDLNQSSFEWEPKDLAAGTYFVTIVVERLGETKVYQPAGELVLASKDTNNSPFVKIVAPNNTFNVNNNQEIQLIQRNRDRLRFPLGEPLRIVYKYLDADSDPVTLSLRISKDDVNWQTVAEKITPGAPTAKDGDEYLFEWTPPADFDPNMYTLRVYISDGTAESFAEQKFIGIGDLTWDGGVNQLYATNCAMSGCHNSTAPAARRDYTRYDKIPQAQLLGYNGNVKTDLDNNCVTCHGSTNPRKNIKLNTFADAKANAAAIKTVLEANTMPVKITTDGTPPVTEPVALNADAKTRILKWISDGTLENTQITQQEIQGAFDNQNVDIQLVNYWLAAAGSNDRKKAMPKGPAPLPPEVLGKFLIWDMQGSNWNDAQKRYTGVGQERKRRN